MNRWQVREQFGTAPVLSSVLGWAVQQALKGYRVRHPDAKRQRRTRLRDLTIHRRRLLKAACHNQIDVYSTQEGRRSP